MGKLTDGVFGGFSGKVGKVVGYSIGGEELLRRVPRRNPNRVPTEKQLVQQIKFGLVMAFLLPIKEVVGEYFSQRNAAKSRFNLAVGYNLTNAVMDAGGGVFELDFNKVLVSKGDLRGMENGAVVAQPDHVLDLSWTDNSGQGSAAATDLLIAVIYSPEQNLFQMFNPAAATRGDGSAQLAMPVYYSGNEVQVWASMISADKKTAANSSYLGNVTVT